MRPGSSALAAFAGLCTKAAGTLYPCSPVDFALSSECLESKVGFKAWAAWDATMLAWLAV
jgi:hypothetical protein